MPARRSSSKKPSFYKKGKRTKKNEGSVMRAEVKKYKDREKAMQNDENPLVSKNRLTRQGLYAHGSTSGKVKRDFGLSKAAQARAEANLSRILELANIANGEIPTKNLCSLSSPKEDSADEVNVNTQNLNEDLNKRKEKCRGDKSESVINEVSRTKNSECSSSEKKTEEDEAKENLNQLAEAVLTGIDCKTRLIGSSSIMKGRSMETLAALKSLPKESSRGGKCGVYIKMQKIKELKTSEEKVKQWSEKHFSSSQPIETLKTPLSQEYTLIPVKNNSEEVKKSVEISKPFDGSKCNLSTTRKRKSVRMLVASPAVSAVACPGTTIINPKALLLRYEKKLEKSTASAFDNLPPTQSSCNKVFKSADRDQSFKSTETRVLNNCLKERENCKSSDIVKEKICFKGLRSDREKQEVDLSSCSKKVVKSVIVNPLDYLKKCEKHSGNDMRNCIEPNISTECGSSTNELCRNSGFDNRDLQAVPEPDPYRSAKDIESSSTDVTREKLLVHTDMNHDTKMGYGWKDCYCQASRLSHQVHGYGDELFQKMDSSNQAPGYEFVNQLTGPGHGLPFSHHLELPSNALAPAVKFCATKDTPDKGNCFSPCKTLPTIQDKSKSCSPALDAFEKAVVNDFVLSRYVYKDPDSLKFTNNLKI